MPAHPAAGCEIPPDVPGKWPKIALWGKELGGLTGTALFIDLDSVIASNIDDYFTYGDPSDVYVARNWVRWIGKHGQTSVFRFPIGQNSYMLENLRANSVEISRKYRFEQNYVTAEVKSGVKFWPHSWTKHFGLHCMGIWPSALPAAPGPAARGENRHLPGPSETAGWHSRPMVGRHAAPAAAGIHQVGVEQAPQPKNAGGATSAASFSPPLGSRSSGGSSFSSPA